MLTSPAVLCLPIKSLPSVTSQSTKCRDAKLLMVFIRTAYEKYVSITQVNIKQQKYFKREDAHAHITPIKFNVMAL